MIAAAELRTFHSRHVVVGLGALAAGALLLACVMAGTTYDLWGGVVIGTFLTAASWRYVVKEGHRVGGHVGGRIFGLALVAKMAASGIRYFVAFGIYRGLADAAQFNRVASQIVSGHGVAPSVAEGTAHAGIGIPTGTAFIESLLSSIYRLTQPTLLGGFMIFSWFAFIGTLLFIRAVTTVVDDPEAGHDRRSYAFWLLLLPTMLYWPSSVGKEAWMILSLGIAVFGAARWFANGGLVSLALLFVGVAMAAVVRPNIALMLVVSMGLVFVLRGGRAGTFPWVGRIVVMLVLGGAAAAVAIPILQSLIGEPGAGIGAALHEISRLTTKGGSGFTPFSVVSSPLNFPAAIVTVIFRPFPFEANNALALATALEGVVLLALAVARRGSWLAVLRHPKDLPLGMMALIFTGVFVIGFSTFGNFGLLARERAQLVPFLLMAFFSGADATTLRT